MWHSKKSEASDGRNSFRYLCRYPTASATCSASTVSDPAKSAMVRATFRMRSCARPESPSRSTDSRASAFATLENPQSSKSFDVIEALVLRRFPNLSACADRARTVLSRISLPVCPRDFVPISEDDSRGTPTKRSMRSMSGQDIRLRYFSAAVAEHTHGFSRSPKYPQGQGFVAARSWNLAGYVWLPRARETRISPSSSGCLSASRR